MKGKHKLWVILAVAFQVGVVAAMAVSREWLLANGEAHLFQTAPVDPRDIFRGDYVRLDYPFSNVPPGQVDEAIHEQGLRKGQKVYLSLGRDENGLSHGRRLYLEPPEGPYLRGYVKQHWPYRRYREQTPERKRKALEDAIPVSVNYGIGRYYVEQGSGVEMEKRRGGRDSFQTPLLIHSLLSGSGEAAIGGYEWANFAVKTEIVQSPQRNPPDEQASAIIRFTLMNHDEKPMRLPLKADNCSFALIPVQGAPEDAAEFVGTSRDCVSKPVRPVILPAGKTLSLRFDLNQPHWRVRRNDKVVSLDKLPWQYRYRIQYRGENIEGVKAAILSSAFHGRGNID